MGQRLVIQNRINGVTINAIYYHWSGYTDSAISEAQDLFDVIVEQNPATPDELNLVCYHYLKENGGGLSWTKPESQAYLEKIDPTFDIKTAGGDRNCGLITFYEGTPASISWSDPIVWSECTIIFDWSLTEQGIDFHQSVYDFTDSLCWYDPADAKDYAILVDGYDFEPEEISSFPETLTQFKGILSNFYYNSQRLLDEDDVFAYKDKDNTLKIGIKID